MRRVFIFVENCQKVNDSAFKITPSKKYQYYNISLILVLQLKQYLDLNKLRKNNATVIKLKQKTLQNESNTDAGAR